MFRGKVDREILRFIPKRWRPAWEKLFVELERMTNSAGWTGMNAQDNAAGTMFAVADPALDIIAKIVCLVLNTVNGVPRAYYGWIQQEFQPDGTFRDLLGGLSGTPAISPAFERNGDLDVEIGTIVRMQLGYLNSPTDGFNLPNQDQEWVFDARVTPIVAQIVSPTGGGTTTLNGGITNVALALVATAFAGFPADQPFFIQIDAEIIKVTAGNCTTGWTIVRAQQGTAAAAHANLAAITQVAPPYSWQEVEETAMGQFTAVAGGRTGTLSLYPAFERNGGATVPIGYYVLLWPGFQDFGLVCGVATTTINQANGINTTDQTVVVTSTVGFPTAPFYIDVDGTETMLVTKVTGTTFTIVRAAKACVTAVSHANGATVTLLLSRLQEWIFDACCTSSSVVTNLTTITNTYAQRKPLLPYDLELKPVRGVRGSTGATGDAGPIGPFSQQEVCCIEETTIVQQSDRTKGVILGNSTPQTITGAENKLNLAAPTAANDPYGLYVAGSGGYMTLPAGYWQISGFADITIDSADAYYAALTGEYVFFPRTLIEVGTSPSGSGIVWVTDYMRLSNKNTGTYYLSQSMSILYNAGSGANVSLFGHAGVGNNSKCVWVRVGLTAFRVPL